LRRQCVHSARQGGEEHLRTTTACCSASSICTATTFPRQIICMRRELRHSQKQNGFWVGRFEFVVVFEGITHLSSNQSPSPAAACMCTLVKCFSSILRQQRPRSLGLVAQKQVPGSTSRTVTSRTAADCDAVSPSDWPLDCRAGCCRNKRNATDQRRRSDPPGGAFTAAVAVQWLTSPLLLVAHTGTKLRLRTCTHE
jgi:hypothetical protein